MLTPFKEQGEIDYIALESLTGFYLDGGAAGLFANCLSSEMFHLDREERLAITEKVIRVADGRVPVVSTGTFTRDVGENAAFIRSLHQLGVASVVVNSNQLCEREDGDGVFQEKLEKLLEATPGIPLGIYECPVPHKRLISERVLSWMVTTDRFSYFKDTCCDDALIRRRLEIMDGSAMSLLNANTPTAVQSLRDGATGISPIGGNFYPELYSWLIEHYMEEENEIFRKVRSFLSVADLVVHTCYPWSAKYFLQQRGLPLATTSRTEIPGMLRDEEIRLRELFPMAQEMFGLAGLAPFQMN